MLIKIDKPEGVQFTPLECLTLIIVMLIIFGSMCFALWVIFNYLALWVI